MKGSKSKNRLRNAIERGLGNGQLSAEINELGEVNPKSRADGDAICWGLQQLKPDAPTFEDDLRALLDLFQQSDDAESDAVEVLREEGIPLLVDIFDRFEPAIEEKGFGTRLFLLKILAMYGTVTGTLKIVEAARRPVDPEGYLWTVVLNCFEADHPEKDLLFRSLSDPLPPGFIGVSLLDAANALLIKGDTMPHPFDSPEGHGRLRAWLTKTDPEEFSYAHSSTAALPFLSPPERDDLLDLALAHPDPGVRMEAAWAAAKVGRADGIARLAEGCRDIKTASVARQYLTELERVDAIPRNDPDFLALSEFAQWCAHPNELGRVPDELEIVDHRELAWPPAREPKPFWIIRYIARDTTGLEDDEIDCGLVGSITFCLFSLHMAERPPEDIYAIHCAWEMEHAGLIHESDVSDESDDYRTLLQHWTGPELQDAQITFIAELDPELNYPQRIVGLALAHLNGEKGCVVLDGPRSRWYPQKEQPASDGATVLKLHLGRQLLGFTTEPDRQKYLAPPCPPRSSGQVIAAYEKQLAAARALTGEKRASALSGSGLLAHHFARYAGALNEKGRGAEVRELLCELAPHFDGSLDGLSALARGALAAGLLEPAEEFLLKFRAGASMFEQSSEIDLLASVWHAQGKHSEAKQLLIDAINELKSADGDEVDTEALAERLSTFEKLFPGDPWPSAAN